MKGYPDKDLGVLENSEFRIQDSEFRSKDREAGKYSPSGEFREAHSLIQFHHNNPLPYVQVSSFSKLYFFSLVIKEDATITIRRLLGIDYLLRSDRMLY